MSAGKVYNLTVVNNPKAILAEVRKQNSEAKHPQTHRNTVLVYVDTNQNAAKRALFGRVEHEEKPIDDIDDENLALANVANALAEVAMPTLYLPFPENMHLVSAGEQKVVPREARYAIEDLYRALGAGMDLAFADIEEYLTTRITPRNRPVFNWYQKRLALLKAFAEQPEDKRIKNFKANNLQYAFCKAQAEFELTTETSDLSLEEGFFKAYQDGQKSVAEVRQTVDPEFYAPFTSTRPSREPETLKYSPLYVAALETQKKQRLPFTILAIIGSIILLPLAPLFYFLWKKRKDAELIQEVKVAPVDMFAISRLRKDFTVAARNSAADDVVDEINNHSLSVIAPRPPVIRPVNEFEDPDLEHTYLADREFVHRHFNIFGKKLNEKYPTRTPEDKYAVIVSKQRSVEIVRDELPKLQPK